MTITQETKDKLKASAIIVGCILVAITAAVATHDGTSYQASTEAGDRIVSDLDANNDRLEDLAARMDEMAERMADMAERMQRVRETNR